jgi:hypothetical protein
VTEFHDLWHNLIVPNDVDLLKQLQSGMIISQRQPRLDLIFPLRWSTRDSIGSPDNKGASGQEKGQKVGDTTTHCSADKYSFEGYGD